MKLAVTFVTGSFSYRLQSPVYIVLYFLLRMPPNDRLTTASSPSTSIFLRLRDSIDYYSPRCPHREVVFHVKKNDRRHESVRCQSCRSECFERGREEEEEEEERAKEKEGETTG